MPPRKSAAPASTHRAPAHRAPAKAPKDPQPVVDDEPKVHQLGDPGPATEEVIPTDGAHEDEAVADPPVAPPAPAPLSGCCDNHPDRPATHVTTFTWSTPQRFCDECWPKGYERAGYL